MTSREALSFWAIQVSVGVGGSFLAAVFASEALVHGGLFIPFAIGVFVAIAACVRSFGSVRLSRYALATLVWLLALLLAGVP